MEIECRRMVRTGRLEMDGARHNELSSIAADGLDRLTGHSLPSSQATGNDEAFQVLWEIGLCLVVFLGIGLAANVLLALFAVSR